MKTIITIIIIGYVLYYAGNILYDLFLKKEVEEVEDDKEYHDDYEVQNVSTGKVEIEAQDNEFDDDFENDSQSEEDLEEVEKYYQNKHNEEQELEQYNLNQSLREDDLKVLNKISKEQIPTVQDQINFSEDEFNNAIAFAEKCVVVDEQFEGQKTYKY